MNRLRLPASSGISEPRSTIMLIRSTRNMVLLSVNLSVSFRFRTAKPARLCLFGIRNPPKSKYAAMKALSSYRSVTCSLEAIVITWINPRITRGGSGEWLPPSLLFQRHFFPRGFFGNASVYLSAIHFHIFWCKISTKVSSLVNLYTIK